jgi:hypothetical protein
MQKRSPEAVCVGRGLGVAYNDPTPMDLTLLKLTALVYLLATGSFITYLCSSKIRFRGCHR